MKKKLLIQAIAFALLAGLMLTGLGLVVREKSGALSELYSLEEGSVSALFSGGSHVNASYIPAVLWEDYGIASINLFSANQTLWTSYYYIKEALKTQRPDVITLELFGLSYGYSYSVPEAIDSDNAVAGFHMRLSPDFYAMAAASSIFGVESAPFPEYLNLVRYHSRWKSLTAADFAGMSAGHDFMRGYELITRVESFEDGDFSESAQVFEPYFGSRIYLDLIRRLAEREGIPLVLCVSPYAVNETERGIYAWARQYAEKHELGFLNYNGSDGERIGIDRSRDLADVGHTNYSGALKVTEDIGAYLSQNYSLRPRAEVSDAAERDADAAAFAAKAEINSDMTERDPAEFFASIAANESYTLLVAGALTEAQLADIAPLGFTDALAGEPFAGLSSGGKAESFVAGEGASISLALGQYEITALSAAPEMTVNGNSFAPEAGEAVFLLFSEEGGWPLDLEWYSASGELAHREFAPSELLELTGG